uniref:F-box protein 36 n=1 Tax=Stegastes partitus TaxID=144197 RepID=A0A3B5A477_9TELE
MAFLLGEQIYQISGQGPPPLKDFFQLEITKNEVIWKSWKISLRPEWRGAPPRQLKMVHHDFLHEKMLQLDAVFGQRILDYTISLCQGKFDYLERLPDGILLRILSYLQLKDTTLLAQSTKLCLLIDKFWEQTVRNRCAGFSSDMEVCAAESTDRQWDHIYLLAATNGQKIQAYKRKKKKKKSYISLQR